jgi:hypothetical protein
VVKRRNVVVVALLFGAEKGDAEGSLGGEDALR